VYNWKRFWCPREGRIQLDEDGFLLEPESEVAAYYDPGVVPFEKIAALPCLALLGEPGLGKSTARDSEVKSVQELPCRDCWPAVEPRQAAELSMETLLVRAVTLDVTLA
jgi:hypothetical protein